MSPPFTLLVVHGDGSRVVLVRVPRWLAYGSVGMVTAALAVAAGLSGEHLLRVRQAEQLATLRQRVSDQDGVIDVVQARVATVRKEIAAWEALHDRMRDALGPAGESTQTASGIGGPSPAADDSVAPLSPLEELDLLASTVAAESPRLRDLEHAISRTGRIMSALPLRWPVRGPVRSEFGKRASPWSGKPEHHPGIDIGTASGTPVQCPAPGTVVVARAGGGYGRHVVLDHGHGVRSLYGHLREVDVKPGEHVEKGQVVGLIGSTGRSTGPHLHYEVRVEGKPVDPRAFLWEQ
jgi:murein DD-endopeptidase MepM/ murein hydrolase activator NlpD